MTMKSCFPVVGMLVKNDCAPEGSLNKYMTSIYRVRPTRFVQ